MFLFALAAQFSLPLSAKSHSTEVRGIFSGDDVPHYLVEQRNVDLVVGTRTTFRPDGSIQSCVAETSSGDSRLDAYTCQLLVRRTKKFIPAQWIDGSSVYGVIRAPVRWQVSSGGPTREHPMLPDLDLSVNQLPKGAHSPVRVDLQIAADKKGHPVSCAERPATGAAKPIPELVSLACQQATATLVLTPPVDASGKPVRSVQSAWVQFNLGK